MCDCTSCYPVDARTIRENCAFCPNPQCKASAQAWIDIHGTNEWSVFEVLAYVGTCYMTEAEMSAEMDKYV